MRAYTDKKTFRDDLKISDDLAKCKRQCEYCGHKMIVAKADRVICSWCGHYIYKNDGIEFKYKVKEMIRNARKVEH